VRKYLFNCAEIFRFAEKLLCLSAENYVLRGNTLPIRRKLCVALKYFHVPHFILFLRGNNHVSCADFLVPSILGMPVCLDYVNDLLSATSAM
jgi:hypothetical protein